MTVYHEAISRSRVQLTSALLPMSSVKKEASVRCFYRVSACCQRRDIDLPFLSVCPSRRGTVSERMHISSNLLLITWHWHGGAENAGPENAGPENGGPNLRA